MAKRDPPPFLFDADQARGFAAEVVRRLRDAGYQSLWAGGCVRDRLMGRAPKDYDVATNATPDEVRRLFGRRRTLAIGAAFGVVVVLGPKGAGQVEVATFRCDAPYSDGRHPDEVTFSTAEEDAQRRDFTINGLFFDPLAGKVIDYVGGVDDLTNGIVRAIGDPQARIAEDKLRMLRAVRFAAAFDFELDGETLAAVQQSAPRISVVSAERIATELRQMLVLPQRARAVRLLATSRLLEEILPEARSLDPPCAERDAAVCQGGEPGDSPWCRALAVLERLHEPTFPQSLAAILREIESPAGPPLKVIEDICRRWRLSGDEIRQTVYLLEHEGTIRRASRIAWPQLQRLLVTDGIDQLLGFAEAVASVTGGSTGEIDYCREKLALPPEQLNPPPLLTGDDLINHGIPPGKIYKTLLDAVRDAQLEGRIANRQQALDLADRLWRSGD